MYQSLDFLKMKSSETYPWMIRAIVPRPIAFVSTVDERGIVNLAPFSFFSGVSSNPPCLVFSVARKPDGSKKDTLINIEKNLEFVVNSTHEWIADEVNACSEELPYGESEVEKNHFHTIPSTHVQPPRIQECEIQMECRLEKLVEVGDGSPGSSTLVIGRILCMHVSDHVLTDGKIDFNKLKPLSRLGGMEWSKGGEVFVLKRPG